MAVGQNVLRKEGYEKLTGAARYVDDLTLEGMLFGKTIRSTVARGRIKSIEFDPGYDWSRIIVADYRDIPGENYVALIENDQPLLVESEVHHYDEPILLIAAASKAELEAASRLIRIEYESLPPVLTLTRRSPPLMFSAGAIMSLSATSSDAGTSTKDSPSQIES
jgi:CO/xanthine dehydrogenase Mo-binding subunit